MKYVVSLMLALIFLAYPLGLFGFTLVPQFSYTLNSFEDTLFIFNNKFTNSLLSIFGIFQNKKKASVWIYDECIPEEGNIIHSLAYQDVYYIVMYPGTIDRESPIMTPLSQFWSRLTGQKYMDTKAKVFFCFNEDGLFVRLFVLSKGNLYFTDSSYNTMLDNSMYSKYQDVALLRYTAPDGDIINMFKCQIVHKGCFIDFIKKY